MVRFVRYEPGMTVYAQIQMEDWEAELLAAWQMQEGWQIADRAEMLRSMWVERRFERSTELNGRRIVIWAV